MTTVNKFELEMDIKKLKSIIELDKLDIVDMKTKKTFLELKNDWTPNPYVTENIKVLKQKISEREEELKIHETVLVTLIKQMEAIKDAETVEKLSNNRIVKSMAKLINKFA